MRLSFSARFDTRTASRVLFEPAPAITLMRPLAVPTTSATTSVLVVRERWRFAGRADRNDALGVGGDLEFDLLLRNCA